jgi:hypothetical protein
MASTGLGGTFLELFKPLGVPSSDPVLLRRALSRSVLDPSVAAKTDGEFIRHFSDLLELSIAISDEQWSLQVLGDLYKRVSPNVRAMICYKLASTYGQCRFSDCPTGLVLQGIDLAKADVEQAARGRRVLRETSEDHVKRYLASGKPRALEQGALEVLSCNFDPIIRRRAAALLHKYFPESQPPPCISCR